MPKVVVLYESAIGGQGWRWIADQCDLPIEWHFISNADFPVLDKRRKPFLSRYAACIKAVRVAKRIDADLIVVHHTYSATWVAMIKQWLGVNVPVMAFAYTLPAWDSFGSLRKKVFSQAAQGIDRFLMFSSLETRMYPGFLSVPAERFDMIHWGVRAPEVDRERAPLVAGRYIASVGGEGRDYATLVAAMKQMPEVRLALVARPDNLAGLDIPDNVTIFQNIPYPDAMNILVNADFGVLPLLSSTTPCGHGTLISGMLLDLPQIVTESEAMEDYLEDGVTALTHKQRDVESMVSVIQRLWSDGSLREAIAKNGKTFAETYCAESVTVDYFRNYLVGRGLL